MKNALYSAALAMLMVSAGLAQDVTKKEAVKTTKTAQANAKQLQKDAKKSGSKSEQRAADKTMDAAKRAEKEAKKNTP